MTSLLKEPLLNILIKLSSSIVHFKKQSPKNHEVVVLLHSNSVKLVITLKKKLEKR